MIFGPLFFSEIKAFEVKKFQGHIFFKRNCYVAEIFVYQKKKKLNKKVLQKLNDFY